MKKTLWWVVPNAVAVALFGVLLAGCDPVGEQSPSGTFEVKVDPSPSISPWRK
jgi:hypothetical protein